QYLEILKKADIETHFDPFFSDATMSVLYKRGHTAEKALGVVSGFIRRLRTLLRLPRYDYVFLFREASPLGPPIFEALMFLMRKKVIYDFDDAIFVAQPSKSNPLFRSLRWNSKTAFICKHSRKVSVCNPYLVDWVSQYNRNTILIPT